MQRRLSLSVIFLIVFALAVSSNVFPQVQRSFVSGTGNDTNPCSITQPCRTLARAVTVSADGGEVVVLDSAGYGSLALYKSISITASDGLYAGITETSGTVDAILISAPDAKVYLRGLSINASPGSVMNGIAFNQGFALTVDRCRIRGFANGIRVTGAGAVTIKDSIISENARGVKIGTAATNVAIVRSLIERNVEHGVQINQGAVNLADTTVTGNQLSGLTVTAGAASGFADRCTFSGNLDSGVRSSGGGTVSVRNSVINGSVNGVHSFSVADVDSCLISGNTNGIYAQDTGLIRVSNTIVTKNAKGIEWSGGGQVLSRTEANNTVEGNQASETFSGTYAAK